jgi:hypothetical protein
MQKTTIFKDLLTYVNSYAPMADALFYTITVTRTKFSFFCQEILQAYYRVEFSLNFKILRFKKFITNATYVFVCIYLLSKNGLCFKH